MHRSPSHAALILAALVAFGCSREKPAGDAAAPTELLGSAWQLEDLAGKAPLPVVEVTLEFPDTGKVIGRASCNRFFGDARFDGASISLGALGATRMACADAVNQQETEYLRLLQAAERYEFDGATLRIYSKGTVAPLRFTRKHSATSMRDPTGVWTITGHREPGVSAMAPKDADSWKGRTLQFGIAEAIAGSDTCVAPSYQRRTAQADSLLSSGYRISAAALGLPSTVGQQLSVTEVACNGKPWEGLGGVLLQATDDHAFAVKDGVFFELQRQQP
jgi:heat shock protein HslJ